MAKNTGPIYSCGWCGAQFDTKDALRDHKDTCQEGTGPLYECGRCGKRFSNYEALDFHKDTCAA